MIYCKRVHLEARCVERGYTLDEVRPCIVSQDGDMVEVDEAHPAYPRPKAAPSLVQKAVNFVVAATNHIAAGSPMASDEVVGRRFAICQQCQHFDGKSCDQCGCPVVREQQYLSKLSWADQCCPVGKWGPASNG